ncbi:MAG: hypothetical protein CM1200mP18_14330 [Gammaproteobacteria bacterium]|nr:MAG: hypothetical protein CM1200mP18_14330 [Gammaproteobacteria bacterium]
MYGQGATVRSSLNFIVPELGGADADQIPLPDLDSLISARGIKRAPGCLLICGGKDDPISCVHGVL